MQSTLTFRKGTERRSLKQAVQQTAAAVLLTALCAATGAQAAAETEPGFFPQHAPLGKSFGIYPGRVVWVRDQESVSWDGSGYWWELQHFNGPAIARMLTDALTALTGCTQSSAAWDKLFTDFNTRRGTAQGYRPGQKIAVKLNMNGSGAYDNDRRGLTHESYGSAVLAAELLKSLTAFGVKPEDITLYDAGRIFPDYMQELCTAGELKGVRFAHRDPGGPQDAAADLKAPLKFSGEIDGEQSFLPLCVTEADYLINLANLKGHVYGITLTAKNHFGSFINSSRSRAPQQAGLHANVWGARPGNYSVLTDLMAHPELGGKTVLYLLDGLLTAAGESVTLSAEDARWQLPPFNGGFCASLFAAQDPVALDSVGADLLANEPTMQRRNPAIRGQKGMENYLHEAALAGDPPSGTVYQDLKERGIESLGVHEHFDSPLTQNYSRNLGRSEGIELVKIFR